MEAVSATMTSMDPFHNILRRPTSEMMVVGAIKQSIPISLWESLHILCLKREILNGAVDQTRMEISTDRHILVNMWCANLWFWKTRIALS